jgi:hypothetical protein
MTPHLLLHLVDPAALVLSRINSWWMISGSLELRIDRTYVNPVALPALLEAGVRTLVELVPLIAANPLPVVRYYMVSDVPDRRLMHMDTSAFQIDVYLQHGLMPQDLADELAGHYMNIARHLTK